MNLSRDEWRRMLGLRPGEAPVGVVLEGTWWEERATAMRTALLDDVRHLEVPGYVFVRWHGVPLVYACAYGAPKAVEPVHLLGSVGARLAVQIGSCGSCSATYRKNGFSGSRSSSSQRTASATTRSAA